MNDTARDYKLRGAALMGSGQYKDAQTQFIKAHVLDETLMMDRKPVQMMGRCAHVLMPFCDHGYRGRPALDKHLVFGKDCTAFVYDRRAVIAYESCSVVLSEVNACHVWHVRVKRRPFRLDSQGKKERPVKRSNLHFPQICRLRKVRQKKAFFDPREL